MNLADERTRAKAATPFGPERMLPATASANDLILLVEIIEAGSYTAAAARLGVPKSFLSRRIAELESSIGTTLLLRNPKGLELTESGQRVYKNAQDIRTGARAAVLSAKNQGGTPSGKLRIACPYALATLYVSEVATAFAKRNPDVRVSLSMTRGTSDVSFDQVDLLIISTPGALPDSGLVARHLSDSPFVLVASPELRETLGAIREPQDLHGLPAIGWGNLSESAHWELLHTDRVQADVEVLVCFSSDNLLVIRDAALAGLGIARLPLALCKNAIAQGELVWLLPGWAPPLLSIYATYPSREHLSSAGRAFLEAMQQAMAGAS